MTKITQSKLRFLVLREVREEQDRIMKENFMTDFLSNFANSGLERFKEYIAKMLLRAVGISPDSFLAKIFVSAIGNLESSELYDILSGDGDKCPLITREILEAVEEAILERIPEMFGMEPDGEFAEIMQEMFITHIFRNNSFNDKLVQAICNLNFDSVLKSLKLAESKNRKKTKPLKRTSAR